MGFYPKISGNTETALDRVTGISDMPFDVYVYQNSGATDNAERANIIVCILNNAADGAGSSADLEIEKVEIFGDGAMIQRVEDGVNTSNASTGWILDPLTSGGVIYIGAPEGASDGTGNKALTSSGQSWKSTEATACTSYVTHPGTSGADTTADNLGTTPTNYNIVPLYTCHTMTGTDANGDFEKPIPANSWAAFVIAYEPDSVESLSNYYLKLTTNAGEHQLDLIGSSFDEVIMGGTIGSISGSVFTETSEQINDGGTWTIGSNPNGCYPRASSPQFLRDIIGNNTCIKVTDKSTNFGQVGWKWKFSLSTKTQSDITNAYPNEGNIASIPTGTSNHNGVGTYWSSITGGSANLWVPPAHLGNMYNPSQSVVGYNVTGMSTYSQYVIAKNFEIPTDDNDWFNGSFHSVSGKINYGRSDFLQSRLYYLRYETNPSNYDNSVLNNELYTFAAVFGVYTKITTPNDRQSSSPLINQVATETFLPHVAGGGYGHKSYQISEWLQNGSEFDLIQHVTYNNFANEAAYNLSSYNFADAVEEDTTQTGGGHFAIYSDNGHKPAKNPYQWSTDGTSGSFSTNTFNAFEGTADSSHAHLKYNILIKRTAQNLYNNTEFPCNFDRINTSYSWDFDKVQYLSRVTDNCWDENGAYPGVKETLHWNYVVPPTLSYISFVPKNTSTVDQYQGSYIHTGTTPDLFDESFSAQIIPEAVTQWYDTSNTGIHNRAGSNWVNNRYSGTNGKVHYDDASRNNTVGSAGYYITKVADWQDINSVVNTAAGTNQPYYRGLVDENGNRKREFRPVDVIYKLDSPSLSPNDEHYYSFGAFRFFNHGDDVVYIHSMKIVPADNSDDIFEIKLDDNNTGDPANPTETNLGYKPNANSNTPEWRIGDYGPQTGNSDHWGTDSASADPDTGVYTEKKYYTAHDNTTQNTPIENYRQDTKHKARFCRPVRAWFDMTQIDSSPNNPNETSSEGFAPLNFTGNDAQDNYGIVTPTFEQLGCPTMNNFYKGTRLFESHNNQVTSGSGSQTQYLAPIGDSLFLIRFKLQPTDTVHDIGTYRAKLVVFTYTHEYANRYKVQEDGTRVTNTHEFSNWESSAKDINLKLDEHHFYIKTTVEPTAILRIQDADDNVAVTDGFDISVGAINIG